MAEGAWQPTSALLAQIANCHTTGKKVYTNLDYPLFAPVAKKKKTKKPMSHSERRAIWGGAPRKVTK